MSRFTGIQAIPTSGVDPWNARILSALKENVELLTGARGEADGASKALTKSSITVKGTPTPKIIALTAHGAGVGIGGASVPTLQDYQNLVRDVQSLVSDVAALRATVGALITQLRT